MKLIITQILSFFVVIFLLIGSIFLIIHIVKATKQTHIKAEFSELAPFSNKMPVYFKGFKIGKITKILPKDDFTTTLMDVTLFPENIKFPKNITLQVKSYKGNLTYAEIVLPNEPTVKRLKDGDIILGKTNMSFDSILERQAENGSIDLIITNVSEITDNINSAAKELSGLLKDVRTTFKNNENYISISTRNLSHATTQLSRTSVSISSTVDEKSLDRTIKNVEETSNNLKNITKNIDCATRNLSETMEHIEGISENIDGITNSVNCTMKNRFGGFRLIFGKADQNCKCKK